MGGKEDEDEGGAGEFETEWVFLTASGWREDLVFTVLIERVRERKREGGREIERERENERARARES